MERERKHLLGELAHVQGLLPLLMKPRNGERWSAEDHSQLMDHFRRLSRMSPYLAAVVLPGGFALLPLLAWWLDQRGERRPPG